MAVQRIQTGDSVVVISGKDKGKQGRVLRILKEDGKVVVEGVNLIKRHTKPSARAQQGGIIEREAPLADCKVMLLDPSTGKGTRCRVVVSETGTKVRVAVKSGVEIPSPRAASSGARAV